MAQIPFASGRTLREDDFDYLMENLKRWVGSQSTVTNHSNESYYPPEIKKEDIRQFCLGVHYAHEKHADISFIRPTARFYCRQVDKSL
jgi:hypothetical protein